VTIYHGDAAAIAPDLPRPDLLILDPPFAAWPEVPKIPATTTLAFTNLASRAAVEALLGWPRSEIVWHFPDGRFVSHSLPLVTHETILIYGPTGSAYVGERQREARPRRKQTHSTMARTANPRPAYVPRERRALDSVLTIAQRPGTAPLGRWSKPEPLLRVLIEFAATGPLVLDPYMGAGTAIRAARDLGLQAIGIDQRRECCDLAIAALAQKVLA
jgi:hypothetical protein